MTRRGEGERRWSRREALRLFGGATAGLAVGGLAGCAAGSRGAPAAEPAEGSGAAPASPAPVRARIGIIQGIAENMFMHIGEDAGIWQAQGVMPEFLEMPDAGTIVKAVVARELEVGEIAAGPLLGAASKGAPVVLVGASKPRLNIAFFVRPGTTQLDDLYGKTIGTAAPGSFLHSLVVALFVSRGMDLDRVSFVNVGPSPVAFQAVSQGKVDAAAATVESVPAAERARNPQVLLYFHEVLPQFFRQAIGMHTDYLRNQPDAALRVAKAWAASTRYGLDHRDEWIEKAAQRYGRSTDDVAWYFDWERANRVPAADLEFDPAMIEYMQQENLKSGAQDAVMALERLATVELQRKVVAELGAYQWPG
jgi:ABC-type nitrate/sulfonate/bicarbonate transport system substrate-binding protein